MIWVVGEILFDIFPDDRRLGGAPFNFAFHLKQLGIPVRFFSRVGNDDNGNRIIDFIKKHGFEPSDIQMDPGKKTGVVDISMQADGSHHFAIIKDVAYDHIKYEHLIRDVQNDPPDMIYFGTLIQREKGSFKQLQTLLNSRQKKTRTFYDMNLRPQCYSKESIKASLTNANILKINHEELKISCHSDETAADTEILVKEFLKGYGIDMVILTMGAEGSKWFTLRNRYKSTPGHVGRIVDTVGAGDAYAAFSAAGILNNLPPERVMAAATEFAAYVCSIKGAIPKDLTIYQSVKNRIKK